VVGVPTIRMSATISPASHYAKWDRTSFKISDKGRRSMSQLANDRESKVSGSTLHCLYRRKKSKRRSGTHAQGNKWHVSHFGLFTIRAVQCLSYCKWGPGPYNNDIGPPNEVTRQEGQSITPTIVKGTHESHCPRWINLNKPMARRNYTRMA
jgi:hypothetical protein